GRLRRPRKPARGRAGRRLVPRRLHPRRLRLYTSLTRAQVDLRLRPGRWRRMVRLSLLAATLGAVLAALAPASASSAVPCRDKIYNDWYKDGKIATTYPIACYRDALKHV